MARSDQVGPTGPGRTPPPPPPTYLEIDPLRLRIPLRLLLLRLRISRLLRLGIVLDALHLRPLFRPHRGQRALPLLHVVRDELLRLGPLRLARLHLAAVLLQHPAHELVHLRLLPLELGPRLLLRAALLLRHLLLDHLHGRKVLLATLALCTRLLQQAQASLALHLLVQSTLRLSLVLRGRGVRAARLSRQPRPGRCKPRTSVSTCRSITCTARSLFMYAAWAGRRGEARALSARVRTPGAPRPNLVAPAYLELLLQIAQARIGLADALNLPLAPLFLAPTALQLRRQRLLLRVLPRHTPAGLLLLSQREARVSGVECGGRAGRAGLRPGEGPQTVRTSLIRASIICSPARRSVWFFRRSASTRWSAPACTSATPCCRTVLRSSSIRRSCARRAWFRCSTAYRECAGTARVEGPRCAA